MDVKGVSYVVVGCIIVAWDEFQWRALVNTVMGFHKMWEKFFNS
jgi:hypothetical protein